MAVRIRLTRLGRTHRPYYRVVAIDGRNHREGRAAEILGIYDPLLSEKNMQVDIDRVHAWVNQGAQLSESVYNLLKHSGYSPLSEEAKTSKTKKAQKRRAANKSRAKKDGKKWEAPNRRARTKHLKAQKQARLAAQEEALAAHRAAKAAAAPAEESTEAPAEG
ncbi:MAG: 30S ribosomal protein S16 [Planctomycetota bacterium]|nr:MAG: 30S ribosomal protein S16 [Planctomycetota bacterium]